MFLSLTAVIACFSLIFPNAAATEESEYDVIVIGAGGGGLGAAAALAKNGMKVLIIEQHEKVGGYMTTFERYPYTFEVSLHAMDGLDPDGITRRTLETVGIMDKIKPVRLDPMYRTVYPKHDLIIPADADEYCELMKKTFPHEAKGIDKLFKTMEKIYNGLHALMALTGGDYGSALATLVQPWKYWPLIKYWDNTLSELLDDCVHDQEFIAIFTQLSGYAGAEPDNVSAIFFSVMWGSYHYGGYYYFEGGSQAVSNAMAEVIEENDGTIMLDTLVTRILIEDGKAVGVRTKPGDEYRCRYVVSNANAPATFFELVGEEHLPKDYAQNIRDLKIGMSSFVVYIGVDHDYRDVFQGMHQIMINTTYDPAEGFNYMYQGVPEKTGYAIANYSVTDPLAAPEGKNAMQVISILPYDWKDGWYEDESYEKYDALKTETAMIYIKRAEEYLPGLRDHIEVMEVGSPRTMEHYTLNPKGTIFGWDNTPEQSLLKRLPQETPIENLYLAGAWTFPGGGQSAVISSGIMAADKIMKKDGR
jgi:prolycopene isomerase